MTIWFTSDQHFGHKNIIAHSGRPFANVNDMNAAIVDRFNARVKPGDIVYHLGDVALDEDWTRYFIPQLAGWHHLIVGNHDRCHPSRSSVAKWVQKYLDFGFRTVRTRHELDVDGLGRCLLSHTQWRGQNKDQRHAEWHPDPTEHRGIDVLLHGHVHELWRVRRVPHAPVMVNVGVDQWSFAPVNTEEIAQALRC